MDLLRAPYTSISGLQASLTEPSRISFNLYNHRHDWCFSGKLLKHREVTCKRTDDNSTLLRSQRGPEGPLTDQGRRPLCQSYLGGCPLV